MCLLRSEIIYKLGPVNEERQQRQITLMKDHIEFVCSLVMSLSRLHNHNK